MFNVWERWQRYYRDKSLNNMNFTLAVSLTWYWVWRARNDWVFKRKSFNIEEMGERIQR